MAALVRPPSVPFNLLPEGRNAEVAQLTEDDSEQGTRRRLWGHEIFYVLLHEEVPPECPGRRLARRCTLTHLSLQLMMRDRLIVDGNVISVTPWNLRVSFISNLSQPEKVTIFVKMAGDRRPLGPRSSPEEERVGPIRQKKTQDNESFHVQSGEYVTSEVFTLPVKVSACFRSSPSQ